MQVFDSITFQAHVVKHNAEKQFKVFKTLTNRIYWS